MSFEDLESNKEEEKKKRHDKFEELKEKANEIAILIRESCDYTLDDYMAFSIVTMMNAAAIEPKLHPPVKYLVNVWINSLIQIDEENNSRIIT